MKSVDSLRVRTGADRRGSASATVESLSMSQLCGAVCTVPCMCGNVSGALSTPVPPGPRLAECATRAQTARCSVRAVVPAPGVTWHVPRDRRSHFSSDPADAQILDHDIVVDAIVRAFA